MLVTDVSEKLAKRFYSDKDFIVELKCPYGKVKSEMTHGDPISTFDLPDQLTQEVLYPSIAICQRCGRTLIVGHKRLKSEK